MTYKNITIIIISVLSITFFYKCSKDRLIENDKEITFLLEPSNSNPRNSEGDFIQLKDGRLIFVYSHYTDGSGDNASAYLAGRYSSDMGRTWSTNDIIILPNEGNMNVMSVSLLPLKEDNIALFYLRKNNESDCILYMRTSDDGLESLSEPIRCIPDSGYFVVNNDRVIRLKSGRIIFPASRHKTLTTETTKIGKIWCYYSDDEGKTWRRGREAVNPDKATTQEPGVIELSDGRLMLFCRTDSGIQYVSFSKDRGETWSELKPGNIRSPLSPASIERIPSTGDLLLVWNNNFTKGRDGGKRTPFNLAVSKDDGATWEKIKTIANDPDGWYCYTAIEFIDGHVLLGHCAGNTKKSSGLATTQITRLSLDWIYRNATSDPFVKYDKNGIVELACNDSDAMIYYTIDGKVPTIKTGEIYSDPLNVNITTPLMMFAVSKGNTCSNLISTFVGTDVYQPAMDELTIQAKGLSYMYYEVNITNTSELEKYSADISGIISNFSIANSNRATKFAFSFNGIIKIEEDGLYTFYLESNDGSTLYIDENKIIDNDGRHGVFEESASISLRKGLHKILLNYFQAGGGKLLNLWWKAPKLKKMEIPDSILYH